MFTDNDDITPTYYIAIEQDLVIECPSLTKALFCLLAVHYIFDLSYHDRVKDFFLFLQEKVMEIASEGYSSSSGKGSKKSASYLSTTSGIECYKNKKD
jgi:hypothetical protein